MHYNVARINSLNNAKYIHVKDFAIISCAALLLGTLTFLHPFSFSENSYATGTNSTTTLTLEPSLSAPVVDPSSVVLALTPEAGGSFVSSTASVDVSTNNGTGYTLSISTVGSDNNLNLGGVTGASDNIGALSSETTLSTFSSLSNTTTMNKWGFTTDNNGSDPSAGQIVADHYLAVPSSSNSRTIKVTNNAANTSTTDVTIATKVNRDLPAGAYNNTVVFTATANTNPDVFMQDFSAEECNALDEWSYTTDPETGVGTLHEGDTVTLYDRRDNNSYKIRKLADGNCWMVENLYLIGGITITSADSDIESDTVSYYMDGSTTTGYYTIPESVSGKIDGVNTFSENRPYDMNNGSKKTGSYYSWTVATAGVGSSWEDDEMRSLDSSICPKRWDLPTGNVNGEWYKMVVNGYNTPNGTNVTNDDDILRALNIALAPNSTLYGYFRDGTKYLYGVSGWWQSSTIIQKNLHYAMGISSNQIYPGTWVFNPFNSDAGSIRCLLNASP